MFSLYYCLRCDVIFEKRKEFNNHFYKLKNIHTFGYDLEERIKMNNKFYYRCLICGFLFSNKKEKFSHTHIMHKNYRFKCHSCNKCYVNKHHYIEHINSRTSCHDYYNIDEDLFNDFKF